MRLVHVAIGLTLVSAAMLKLDAARKPFSDLEPSGRLAVIASVGEVIAGAALISGVRGYWVRRGCLALFFVFTIFAIGKAFRGASSCGCFGALRVPPWATACFDLTSAGVLVLAPVGLTTFPRQRVAIFTAMSCLLLSLGLWLNLRAARATALAVEDSSGGVGSLSVLQPKSWIGQPFTLARHIELGDQLNHGRWILLLVHHDCDHCLAAIPRYLAMAGHARAVTAAQLAIVEMPPYGEQPLIATSQSSQVLLGRLDAQRDWFAVMPLAILLEDGIVRAAAEGGDGEQPNLSWWEKDWSSTDHSLSALNEPQTSPSNPGSNEQ
jgi:hypothetical protein